MIKVLNLYAGIGGNRKLWKDVEVTAVEYNEEIAGIYSHYYPCDTVVVGDAHQYLLENYNKFDFIWSSPPCPSHSKIRVCGAKRGLYPAVYPDIKLWEEVVFLTHYAPKGCKWVVENVTPYYDPIIEPTFKLDRHCFWSNFHVTQTKMGDRDNVHNDINSGNRKVFGFDISGFGSLTAKEKGKALRNMVNPEAGQHIFETAMKIESEKKEYRQVGMFT